jgi:predicted lipoprotein with Yx(FWY)xxD motif
MRDELAGGRGRPTSPPTAATAIGASLALALALAACSSSSKTTTTAATSSTTPTTAATTSSTAAAVTSADVNVAQTSLGKVLVDKDGKTLYLFTKDTAGTSTCTGVCATAWPPLTVTGAPTKGAGVSGTITTLKRQDGTTQVVIDGHPLYTFSADSKPGSTSGNDVEDSWYAVTPAGSAVSEDS